MCEEEGARDSKDDSAAECVVSGPRGDLGGAALLGCSGLPRWHRAKVAAAGRQLPRDADIQLSNQDAAPIDARVSLSLGATRATPVTLDGPRKERLPAPALARTQRPAAVDQRVERFRPLPVESSVHLKRSQVALPTFHSRRQCASRKRSAHQHLLESTVRTVCRATTTVVWHF